MKSFIIAGVLALACAASARAETVANRPDVEDQSSVQSDGARVLKLSILIHAPRDKAWEAFATTPGLISWEAPVAAIDLRVGGYLEASYDEHGKLGDPDNIKHQITAFDPGHSIEFHNVQTPHGFPYPAEFGKVRPIVSFDHAGPGMTRVSITDIAYPRDKGDDWLYGFFHSGNAYVLELLKAHLEGTPPPTGPAH